MGIDGTESTVAREPQVLHLIRRAAEQLGLRIRVLDPEYGHLFALTDGRRNLPLLGGRSPLNNAVAARICEDKYYTGLLLEQAGIRVPACARCLKPGHFELEAYRDKVGKEPGREFVGRHGFPVVVKPNRLSHGRQVRVVNSDAELSHAIDSVWQFDYIALVQEAISGTDIRLDYLDGKYLAGYIRTAGKDTDAGSQAARKDAPVEILNLARGAVATVIDSPPRAFNEFCCGIGRFLNLRHFGVDLKAASLDADPASATVIEVNASPLLVQIDRLGFTKQALGGQVAVLRAIWDAQERQGETNP